MFESFKPTESLTPDDGNLVFDSTGGGGRSTLLLPYIEQHGGEANDGGIVINWTTGDGPKGWDSVGVIAIITPTEHGGSVLEFSVENVPNTRAKADQVMKGWPASAPLARRAATALTRASSSIGLAATALATKKAMPFPRRPSALWRAFTPSTI
jgi:hypothetical protein